MASDLDRITRVAIKLRPKETLNWILPDLDEDLVFGGWANTELIAYPGETGRRCDTVAILKSKSRTQQPWLSVLEVEDTPPPMVQEKVLEYKIRLRREMRHGPHQRDYFPISGCVLFLSGKVEHPLLEMALPGTDLTLTSKLRAVCPGELDLGEFLDQIADETIGRSLLTFGPLMRGADRERNVKSWVDLATLEKDQVVLKALPDLAIGYAEWKRVSDVWKTHLEKFNMWQSKYLLEQKQAANLVLQRENVLRFLRSRFPKSIRKFQKLVASTQSLDTLTRCLDAIGEGQTEDQIRAILTPKQDDDSTES